MSSRWAVAALSASAIVLAAEQAPAQAPTPVTAFVHVTVVPMDRERILQDQTVLVRGGHVAVLDKADKVHLPADAVLIDGRGKFLLPGMADMHVHLDNIKDVDGLAPETALLLYIANGVTTVRNMRGDPDIVALRDRAARGEFVGPRIYTSGPTIYNAEEIATPQEARALIAAQKAAGYDFIKVHDIEIAPEAFDTFAALAQRAGMPFAGHTPKGVGVERMLLAHPASSEHLSRFYLYLVGLDATTTSVGNDSVLTLTPDESKIARLAQLVKQAGTWICPTELIRVGYQSTTDTTDFPAFLNTHRLTGPEAKGFLHRRTMIKAFHDAGVGLLVGTDGGPGGMYSGIPQIPAGGEIHTELALFVKAGLTPYQALEAATRNSAVFLGALDSTGTIAVGKRADLVLLDKNPLEDIGNTTALVGTMLGGRWLPREAVNAQFAAGHVPKAWYR